MLSRILRRLQTAGADDEAHKDALDKTGFWGARGAGALLVANTTKRILWAYRSEHVQEPLTWGLWGGAIDSGENPRDAVVRELREETGYRGKVLHLNPLYVFQHTSGFRYFNFLAHVEDEFVPKLDWENRSYRWTEFGDWPSPLHPGAAEMLRHSGRDIEQALR